MLDVDIGFFKRAPFFADFDIEPLKLIAFSADTIDLDDGDVLFSEGEVADCGFVLVLGNIDLLQDGPTGRALVETLDPGTLIGEIALLVETERPATAVAAGSARVYRVPRKLFLRVLGEYPVIAERLRAAIVARIAAVAPDLAILAARLAPPDAESSAVVSDGVEPEAAAGSEAATDETERASGAAATDETERASGAAATETATAVDGAPDDAEARHVREQAEKTGP